MGKEHSTPGQGISENLLKNTEKTKEKFGE